MEHGLSPPRRIESRRNREMVKKQVHTMATAEKIAPGSDWYISVWTTDEKGRIQDNGGVHAVAEGACRARKLRERRAAKGNSWPHPECGVPWTKRGGHRRPQCVHPGAATRSQCARESGQAHETPHVETESRLGTLRDQDWCN